METAGRQRSSSDPYNPETYIPMNGEGWLVFLSDSDNLRLLGVEVESRIFGGNVKMNY